MMNPHYQFNYYINTICNQYCDYCYARNGYEWNKIKPLRTILTELSWFKEFKHKSIITLIGGEPTLHPKFNEIVTFIAENLDHYLHIYTNGQFNVDKVSHTLKHNALWTFSYHGKYVKDEKLFIKNIEYFINNNIDFNITIIAQNTISDEFFNFLKNNNLKEKISVTFIHESNDYTPNETINSIFFSDWFKNTKNMVSFYDDNYFKKNARYKGRKCYYNEIDILDGKIHSNECNIDFCEPFTKEALLQLPPFSPVVCDRDYCKQDCAFLFPKKV